LSYYTPFALTPLILVSMTVLSIVYGNSFVIDMLLHWGGVLGPDLVTMLEEATVKLQLSSHEFTIPVIGTIFFFSMVIIAFNTVASGFNSIWDVPHTGFIGWLRKCWRSLVFVFVLQVYFIFMMGLDGLFVESQFALIPLATSLVSVVATTLLFYLMYRFLPSAPPSRRGSLFGAFIASLLLLITKEGVAFYVNVTPIPKLFDAAGLVFVLLIWIYVAAVVVYYGAALVHEYDKMRYNLD
jgi:membrane protein